MLYFCIVGTRDNPIYELELPTTTSAPPTAAAKKEAEHNHLSQFIVHSALDIVEESMWATNQMYLKVVDRFNEHHVSAYVTPSGVPLQGAKFMLVHDAVGGDVRSFFVDVHELYVKVLLNPFSEINGPINSQLFDVKLAQQMTNEAEPQPDAAHARLLKIQQSIDALVDLIPAKVYLAADESFGAGLDKFSTHNAKKQSAPKQAVKDASKKARKWKLDPSSEAQTSTSDAVKQQVPSALLTKMTAASTNGTSVATSIADLRVRVKEKIADLRMKRGLAVETNKAKQLEKHGKKGDADSDDDESASASTKPSPAPRSRQEILEKRLKKRKERQEKLKKKKQGEGIMGGSKKDIAAGLGKAAVGEETLEFSRLNFTAKASAKSAVTVSGANPSTTLSGKKSDAKSLLTKLTNQTAKLESLATTNPTKHAAIVETAKWEKAAAMASGEVVKDDIKLVKKTVKKLEKRKDKSKGEWRDRIEGVAKTMMDKQKKRVENLKARSDGKKKNGGLGVKKGAGVKKGKSGGGGGGKKRAGFEGGRRK
ncbi:hypothetical protein CcCBS67573_g04327 [Chytriomyces confervae]|uniref:Ribosomal RNA-processing protein 14/surfeit locus protein 6 C-terminal domain-containing protein n=1 Tax=Chytriomyces confervae TaxID=246404 RepID=A0A507FE59_9FUNG|nr:hypothetical protein CcCBS67573_g04327 [Chytriomyces confervae]